METFVTPHGVRISSGTASVAVVSGVGGCGSREGERCLTGVSRPCSDVAWCAVGSATDRSHRKDTVDMAIATTYSGSFRVYLDWLAQFGNLNQHDWEVALTEAL